MLLALVGNPRQGYPFSRCQELRAQVSQHLAFDDCKHLAFLYVLAMVAIHCGDDAWQTGHDLHDGMLVEYDFARHLERGPDDARSRRVQLDSGALEQLVLHRDPRFDLVMAPAVSLAVVLGRNGHIE